MTVRIDTVRRSMAAARELLDLLERDLDDLHALAYDRPRGGDRPNVRGGARDYALDRHGDPKARALLRTVSATLDANLTNLVSALLDARAYLREGEVGRRVPVRRVSSTELSALIAAQHRRRARGEYVPNRTYPQPDA